MSGMRVGQALRDFCGRSESRAFCLRFLVGRVDFVAGASGFFVCVVRVSQVLRNFSSTR